MLRIKSAQVAVLGRTFVDDFVERMVVHLGTYFPRPCGALGPDGLRALIRRGIERAQGHGIASERDVCVFLGLMLTFGEDFDKALPWARAIVRDRDLIDGHDRIDRLADAGEEHEHEASDGAGAGA